MTTLKNYSRAVSVILGAVIWAALAEDPIYGAGALAIYCVLQLDHLENRLDETREQIAELAQTQIDTLQIFRDNKP